MAPQVTDRPRRLLLAPPSLSTMILYLLFTVLILGIVESQTANMPEEEWSKVDGNQTFSEYINENSTMKPGNVTFSFYRDVKSHIEEELQSNQTRPVITEDNENFQDQFPARHCQQDVLVNYSHGLCGDDFHKKMLSISPGNWCVLENIIRPYNDLTLCLEWISNLVGCYYPNPDIQDFFLHIHSSYFQSCSKEELLLVDAPHGVVIALTVIPVSLIPVLVYLVVWKSKVPE
ncbi:receptor activity-modifying protein 1 isoform X2 [Enoplosus armatus]|uniref:receptor activity-modifying protein 1 isoform X2 n=1 Tax=Enoplosus armatus TaxID=215367 RepID=UPI003995C20C